MAASTKPSVRSTRRNNTLVNDAERDRPPSHLGKRLRNATSTKSEFVPAKKLRSEKILPARPKVEVREEANHHKKQLSRNNDVPLPSTGPGARGGRVTSAVQPPATGTIIASDRKLNEGVDIKPAIDASTQSSHVDNELKPHVESDKRTLRSQDGGSRSKSELSLYFPNYEEFISNEPKEAELLSAETRLFISEEPLKSPISTKTFIDNASSSTKAPNTKTFSKKHLAAVVSTKPNSPMKYTKVDLESIIPKLPNNTPDPLASLLFHKAHRRAERQEKQLKNIEKERAQHEKVQLERIFDGLRGPDWLRVMGISGITEGERKSWEGKRAWCIREVGALLEKFRLWKEEERRRKQEKELGIKEEDDDDEELGDSENVREPTGHASPASSDVDAMAALQLHQETLSASTRKLKSNMQKRRAPSKLTPRGEPNDSPKPKPITKELPSASVPLTASEALQRPLVSFFAKPHQRAAALDKTRRSGRKKLAFGHLVPEPPHCVFELPAEMVTEEARKSNARSRRRVRRETGI